MTGLRRCADAKLLLRPGADGTRAPEPCPIERWPALIAACCFVPCFLNIGCSRNSDKTYVPASATARDALTAALGAWQNGRRPGKIETAGAAVQAVDSQWQAGAKLRGFEILGEQPSEGPKQFSVRLSLDELAKDQEVRYVVVGRDPIWVVREEDYAQFRNM